MLDRPGGLEEPKEVCAPEATEHSREWLRVPHIPGACSSSPSSCGDKELSHRPLGRNPSSIHSQVSAFFCTPITVHHLSRLSDHLPSQDPTMA